MITMRKYQVWVISEDGSVEPFEDTEGAETEWTVRGLAFGHRYGFRIRAVNESGPGIGSEIIYETPARLTARPLVALRGSIIPLIDADRQSLIVRLNDIECRIRIWWQPSDSSWWGSLEVPVNTPAVLSRRLAVNTGLLDRIDDVLPGNIVMRSLGGEVFEPRRDAWSRPTHALMWEPDTS